MSNTSPLKKENNINDKIIFLMEKLSGIFRFLMWNTIKSEGLSPIQLQFLLYLKKHSEKLSTVSNLSREFGLSNATVSDAITSLMKKGLVLKKRRRQGDRRVVILTLTPSGKKTVDKLGRWNSVLNEYLKRFSHSEREMILLFLMELIGALFNDGVISSARMCITCNNHSRYIGDNGKIEHHCSLLKKSFDTKYLRVECNEYISNKEED